MWVLLYNFIQQSQLGVKSRLQVKTGNIFGEDDSPQTFHYLPTLLTKWKCTHKANVLFSFVCVEGTRKSLDENDCIWGLETTVFISIHLNTLKRRVGSRDCGVKVRQPLAVQFFFRNTGNMPRTIKLILHYVDRRVLFVTSCGVREYELQQWERSQNRPFSTQVEEPQQCSSEFTI